MKRELNYNKTFKEQGLEPFRETDVYTVNDNNFLSNLTVSETILHPGKNTSGHKHDDLDEVYIFTSGTGFIEIDDKKIDIFAGSIICVHGGEFHKVFNDTSSELKFIAIFQKYNRKEFNENCSN
jgi:mannose-6-phosphate isomerase-like protein (cupin superfamily)